jgi:hypothetical protein
MRSCIASEQLDVHSIRIPPLQTQPSNTFCVLFTDAAKVYYYEIHKDLASEQRA